MHVARAGGSDSAEINLALAASDNRAVFVRYTHAPSCAPMVMTNGGFDAPGTEGLYIGVPRTQADWIGGRPTFDVFDAPRLPLPDFYAGRNGPPPNPQYMMTAAELFDLYTTVWAESASIGDPAVSARARGWIARNPGTVNKIPAREIINGAAVDLAASEAAQRVRPFGGTFALTLTAPGGDTLTLHARTVALSPSAGVSGINYSGSTTTGVFLRSFEWNVRFATTGNAFRDLDPPPACGSVGLLVEASNAVPQRTSVLRATMDPSSLERCMFTRQFSAFFPSSGAEGGPDPLVVTFRIGRDSAVTLEGTSRRAGAGHVRLRGVRTSTVVAR